MNNTVRSLKKGPPSGPFLHVTETPIGRIGLDIAQGHLRRLDFLPADHPLTPNPSSGIDAILAEIMSYFRSPNHTWTLNLQPAGTPFQRQVWDALCQIPAGMTMTYGELAKQLSTSPRAIGQACRVNPLPIVIPCHRIVAANTLGGYTGYLAGDRILIKKWLLDHECGAIVSHGG